MFMKVKNSKYDITVNLVCIILLVGTMLYLGVNWNSISDKIPVHFNAIGVADRWGNKGELLVLQIISWIMYLGMTAIEHYPQIWNTGVIVTEENKERVYRILKNMLGTLKLTVVVVFMFLTINSALAQELPTWFLPIFLVLLFGPMIFFIKKLVRAK